MSVAGLKSVARRALPKGAFARNVSVLVGGTVAGRLIIVAASPILTRLYSPADFGLLAVFAGLVATISVVASLRYQLAIPLPESDRDAASVATLSALVVLGMTLLTAIAAAVWGQQIARLLNTPALAPYIWLVPLGVFFIGIYQVLNYWAIRTKDFTVIARTTLAQAIANIAVQLGGYMLGPIALLFGQVTGQAAGNTSLALNSLRPHWATFKTVTQRDVRQAAVRWRRFPIFDTWSGALNTAGRQLPNLLFAALFSPAVAGIYMLAERVLQTPMSLLGGAIAQVFFSRSAEAKRSGQLAPLVAGIHAKLAQIGMPPMLLLMVTGPDLFAFVFGEQWRHAGVFSQWMAPWLYLVFVTSPLSQLFSVLEKQTQGLMFNGVLFFSRLAGLLYGAYLGNLTLAIALFALAGAACWLGFLIWIIRASGNTWRHVFTPSAHALAVSLALLLPLLLQSLAPTGFAVWLGALALSALLMLGRYFYLLRGAWA